MMFSKFSYTQNIERILKRYTTHRNYFSEMKMKKNRMEISKISCLEEYYRKTSIGYGEKTFKFLISQNYKEIISRSELK